MRILHIYADPSLLHGASVFEYRIARQLKQDGIFFDYLVARDLQPRDAALYAENGSVVHHIHLDSSKGLILQEIKANIAYYKFFKSHDYSIVYADTENALRAVHLLMARLAGVKVRVVHSHNTSMQTTSRLSRMIARVMKHIFPLSCTHFFACSDAAARWLFPPCIWKKKKYTLARNGVDLDAFRFDAETRRDLRRKLGVEDHQLLLGHVGRFMPQKNHAFLLEIFAEAAKKRDDIRLMLIGEGPLKEEMEKKAAALGIAGRVIFTGGVSNVGDYYQAMDAFIMPSLFEGLPVTGVEAQAAGLNCIFSDTITRELAITDLARYLPINDIQPWVQAVCALENSASRRDVQAQIIENGYSLKDTAAQLRRFYQTHGGGAC